MRCSSTVPATLSGIVDFALVQFRFRVVVLVKNLFFLFFGPSSIEFQNNEKLGAGGFSVDLKFNKSVLSANLQ